MQKRKQNSMSCFCFMQPIELHKAKTTWESRQARGLATISPSTVWFTDWRFHYCSFQPELFDREFYVLFHYNYLRKSKCFCAQIMETKMLEITWTVLVKVTLSKSICSNITHTKDSLGESLNQKSYLLHYCHKIAHNKNPSNSIVQ